MSKRTTVGTRGHRTVARKRARRALARAARRVTGKPSGAFERSPARWARGAVHAFDVTREPVLGTARQIIKEYDGLLRRLAER
jgi:hypothetical protein